jgi:hypothetical protein
MKPTLTPEDAERFSKREVIKDDDSTAVCTKTGWDRWENYRRSELQKMKDKK